VYAVNKTRLLGGVFDAIFYFLTYFPYKKKKGGTKYGQKGTVGADRRENR
jgi:hypothetical protein